MAGWPTFGKELLIRLTIFVMSFCNFDFSHFGLEGWKLVLIVLVPGHCLPFTFYTSVLLMQLNIITD